MAWLTRNIEKTGMMAGPFALLSAVTPLQARLSTDEFLLQYRRIRRVPRGCRIHTSFFQPVPAACLTMWFSLAVIGLKQEIDQ